MSRALLSALLLLVLAGTAAAFDPRDIVLKDPTGDDKGPGKYTYPTDPSYKPGSFDLTGVRIKENGASLEITVGVRAKIEDPWRSRDWGGNGFSLQMVQLYLDTKKGGFLDGLPGMNVKFPRGQAWDKVVFISPQPRSKILAEAKAKTKLARMAAAIVVPSSVSVRGNEIVAVVPKSELGGAPTRDWGFQALMQSNEGYSDADSLLARKVNEVGGQHRFGGGSDFMCDPHVLDLLAGAGRGGADEKEKQFKALSAYTCDASGNGSKAVVPMLYPGK
jgi:carbohydrate-binding DOMON domain-containing protein